MKISSTEEYGLRILILLAKQGNGMSINDIAEMEGITQANVAKICRVLRMNGFIKSKKGHTGGYEIANPPETISLDSVMKALGEPLYGEGFCNRFIPGQELCTNNLDCSVRSVWQMLQDSIDKALAQKNLADLLPKQIQEG